MSDGEEDLGQSPPAKRMRRESGEPGEEDSNTPIKMDNSREVVTKIASLYAERLMSDVLLVVGDEELPAHRLILCASSDVFQVCQRFRYAKKNRLNLFLGYVDEFHLVRKSRKTYSAKRDTGLCISI